MYIAEVVVQSGGRENEVSEDSDNSLRDAEQMDTDMQELANDIANVCMFLVLY